jgi:hypothetical protein
MLTLASSRASTLFGQGVAAFQFLKFRLYGHDWIIETLACQNVDKRQGALLNWEIEAVKTGKSAGWVACGQGWHGGAISTLATAYITWR